MSGKPPALTERFALDHHRHPEGLEFLGHFDHHPCHGASPPRVLDPLDGAALPCARDSPGLLRIGPHPLEAVVALELDMDATRSFRAALWFAGAVAIVAGLVHASWHFFFRAYPEMGGLREEHWEVFSLFNFSIGLLLLFMGAVALAAAASRASTLAQLRTLAAFLAATWSIRFLLELAYPVRIPLLVVTTPSVLLKVLMGLLIAALVAPQLLLMTGATRRSLPPGT
jgi:hypothetical protein